ncbi:glycine-rich domain-containing protein [Lysinibacillus xylanilyticus]|uniref:Glycine-rich domain-containing protein n=1 Tax=Lysinibacillus xylanilyticus TaxID=582475 RepID=A0A2M9Q784_9BACI|nr:hypothetical protein [Lysinibacillus xylanilyticus]PJO43928.1 hypothetical protein CWD94_10105 [Lysinibacillus xylanilyticus]
MSTQTKNYGFTKDNENDFYNVNTVNNNLDKIDTEMKRIEEEAKSFNQQVADNTKAIAAVDTKVDNHIKEDLGHVRYIGTTNSGNAWVCVSDDIIWETVGLPLVRAKIGSSYKIQVVTTNTGNITLTLKNKDGSKVTNAYPVLNLDGTQIPANSITSGAMVTVSFNGGTFFLQGSRSGVNVQRGKLELTTPGTHSFTVPKGVSKLTAYIFGAGGGGGGCSTDVYYGGGGGGAGAFMLASIDVKPDDVLSLVVGAGGFGPSGANNGQPGGMSGITIAGLQYQAGGGGGGTYASGNGSYPWGNGGQGGMWSRTGTTGLVGVNDTANGGIIYTFANSAPSNFLMSYSGGSGDCGKTPNYGGGGGGGPSDAQGGFPANQLSPGAAPSVYCNVQGGKGGSGDYKGSGNNGGLAAGGGGSSSTVGKAGDGGNGKIILHW